MRSLAALLFLVPAAAFADGTLPSPLAEGEGAIFCPGAACSVEMKLEGGKVHPVRGGTKVKVVEQTGAVATIEVEEKKGTVANAALMVEQVMSRSADGKAAVFTPVAGCAAAPCTVEVWVFAGGNVAKIEGADWHGVTVSWKPDGTAVAIGTRQLDLVEVPAMLVSSRDDLYAPRYAPDGTLFARLKADDAVVRAGADGNWKALARPPKLKKPAESPPPVDFEEGGKVIVAQFGGAENRVTVRYTPEGKVLPKKK